MPLHINQLPAAIQKQIRDADAARTDGREHDGLNAATPAAARRADPGKQGDWRCHACGYEPTSWADAERHSDAEHHYRIEVVVVR